MAEKPLRPAFRAFAGFAAGVALWGLATPAYNRVLAGLAEPVVRLLERPAATRLYPDGRRILVDRSDFPSTSDRPSLPADDLTFDVILLLTLAGTTKGLFRDRAMSGLGISLLALFGLHVAALVAAVQAFYATQLGAWSAAHYGAFARNVWGTASHFWRLAGCFAAPFLLWWLLIRPAGADAPARSGGRKGSRSRRKKRS
ncbi:MAG: hypothetical protein WCC53_07900 [Thermoanaerobaculia bacterium]